MHGFALNVATNLAHFKNIIPCGIKDADKDVTSMEQEIGEAVDIEGVKIKLRNQFAQLFDLEYI
ncbi:MAG: lipoyl(octanoyl) transferase, partial [Bacteroidota bacterium]